MPMDIDTLRGTLEKNLPNAQIEIEDLRGDNDHYAVHVISPDFVGKNRVQQHRMVYDALEGKMTTELHALSVQTSVPKEEG